MIPFPPTASITRRMPGLPPYSLAAIHVLTATALAEQMEPCRAPLAGTMPVEVRGLNDNGGGRSVNIRNTDMNPWDREPARPYTCDPGGQPFDPLEVAYLLREAGQPVPELYVLTVCATAPRRLVQRVARLRSHAWHGDSYELFGELYPHTVTSSGLTREWRKRFGSQYRFFSECANPGEAAGWRRASVAPHECARIERVVWAAPLPPTLDSAA